jgi:hypothetical protein
LVRGSSCSGNIFSNGVFTGIAAGDPVTGIMVSKANPFGMNHLYISVSPAIGPGYFLVTRLLHVSLTCMKG